MSILSPSTRGRTSNNSCSCGGSYNQYRLDGKLILKCSQCGKLAPATVTDAIRKAGEDSRAQAGQDWWNKSGKPPSQVAHESLKPPETVQEGSKSPEGENEPEKENPPADTTQASPAGVQTERKKIGNRKASE